MPLVTMAWACPQIEPEPKIALRRTPPGKCKGWPKTTWQQTEGDGFDMGRDTTRRSRQVMMEADCPCVMSHQEQRG